MSGEFISNKMCLFVNKNLQSVSYFHHFLYSMIDPRFHFKL